MNVSRQDPPREFEVGFPEHRIRLRDCGRIELEADEQITFTTRSGGEYDVVRKEWGFYATPSTNGRLLRFGLRAVLVRNRVGQIFVLLVEKGMEEKFESYRVLESLSILCWLDDPASLGNLNGEVK